ncbi:uncharacterized protein [Porites lutea]|uniref:uncharacterized protein n=1 Tax=Porites lutea TaxID=51062 RepID=UPI003CC64511
MGYHFNADDTQLHLSFNSLSGDDQAYSVSQVESCVRDIDRWMSCNKLKLNRDKTELLVFSSKYRPRPSLDSILVGDHRVERSDKARNIGVVFDETLSLDKRVSSVCKSALFHLRNIAKIRMYLGLRAQRPSSMLMLLVDWTIVTRCSSGHRSILFRSSSAFKTALHAL